MAERIAVIGGGVIGLSTAITLADKYDVTVVAEKFAADTRSTLATAVWHVYLIRGEAELGSDDIHLDWAETTLNRLIQLASTPGAGVEIIEGVELFRRPRPDKFPAWMERAKATSTNLRFLTDDEVAAYNDLPEDGVDPRTAELLRDSPVKFGYRLQAPAADMAIHLGWLYAEAQRRGVSFLSTRLPRLSELGPFLKRHPFSILVNCTGIEAEDFAGDSSFTPYRGEYFLVEANDEAPRCYVGDDDNPLGMAYAIPRFSKVAVGGLATRAEPGESTEARITWQSVRERASLYFPWLNGPDVVPTQDTAIVGFRPVRRSGVRLEVERIGGLDATVIHNYGHGGSGWSLSWGCAEKVLIEVDKIAESQKSLGEIRSFSLDKEVEVSQPITVIERPDLWRFQDYFEPLRDGPFAEPIKQANSFADNCGIESHEFFRLAHESSDLLRFWASQELVTTNAFSQLLLGCCSTIENVHARSMFMPVIDGEHYQRLRDGVAEGSHPWLLKKLCRAIQIDEISVSPAHCTVKFLTYLRSTLGNVFRALGALGVGNERMLIPEYTAVMQAFERQFPGHRDEFKPFLFANIHEDKAHSEALQDLAGKLVRNQNDYDEYISGVEGGVRARMSYYDELVAAFRNQTWKAYFNISDIYSD